jgi:hypothetical protein
MEKETNFQNEAGNESFDVMVKAAAQVKAEVERLVEEFDLQAITKKVKAFGKENPVEFAVTALALGVVAGLLMRAPKNITKH